MKLKGLLIWLAVLAIFLIGYLLVANHLADYFNQNITEISVGEFALIVYGVSGLSSIFFKRR